MVKEQNSSWSLPETQTQFAKDKAKIREHKKISNAHVSVCGFSNAYLPPPRGHYTTVVQRK